MANYIKQLKDNDGNNIYPLAYVNGGMKMDLLWTNPSPTSDFAAQTVSLDLSDYKLVLIMWVTSTSSALCRSIISPIAGDEIQDFYLAKNGTDRYSRQITATSSGISFSPGWLGYADDNSKMIPYMIYGIKMSYIVPTEVHGLQYVEVE